MREAYLDNSATTRCFPEVVELMNKIYLEEDPGADPEGEREEPPVHFLRNGI